MLDINNAFSGFAVKDIEEARSFYAETLGLEVEDGPMGLLNLHLTGSTNVLVYPKPDHEPAVFTILNFEVPDIDAAVTALTERSYAEYDTAPAAMVVPLPSKPDRLISR